MARYLLIEFDDNEQADALRRKIEAATRSGKKFRVVGLFGRPGKWCSCTSTRDQYRALKAERGGKLGWWVCPQCHRPRLGDHQPTNLLGVDEVIEPRTASGIDIWSEPPTPRPYKYHPASISLTLLPHQEE